MVRTIINTFLFVVLFQFSLVAQDRKPQVAGRFYAGQPEQLKAHLNELFSKAVPRKTNHVKLAIIAPHAGYVFSGEVAASAHNQVDPERKIKRVFVIGSSHTSSFSGASIYNLGNYKTPLGIVPVDIELAQKLIDENELITYYPRAHVQEHSLEVQLPFLQYHLKNKFKIVPIIIGSQQKETSKQLAKILKLYLNQENLFVISSDFSHYPEYNTACAIDKKTAEAIQSNNPNTFLKTLSGNNKKRISTLATSICGWTSALTLLYMTEDIPGMEIDLVQYKNSGDSQFGDKNRVVGYNAISFYKNGNITKGAEFSISRDEKETLLKIARQTIVEYIGKGTVPEIDATQLSEILKTNCGAFVTLNKNHRLRGCIGRFDASFPLYQVVQAMAVAAATQDHRFSKVQQNEISQLEIEISVLTPLKKINSADEFQLGKHGIYIKKGNISGTFLPQVATETGWSKEEFLGHCARDKAGIGWDGWKDAELYTYEALVFGE